MCGIVGAVGTEEAIEIVLDGLARLEYRGYDSAGIAAIIHNHIESRRKKGKLSALRQFLQHSPLGSTTTAIGHTRWATHGKPSDENAHPHCVDDIVVVHNGIIENFLELSHELQQQGRIFQSETDTEVIAHLIAVAPYKTLRERVLYALGRIRGAYAIAVISSQEPNRMIVAKNASPLIIGICNNMGLIASDIPALLPYTRKIISLEEGEMAIVEPGHVELFRITGEAIHREPKTIEWSVVVAEKGGHKHFMHKEIFEQPRSVADTLRTRINATETNADLEPLFINTAASASRILLTACGTSLNACGMGRLAIEELARIPCDIELASELRYRNPVVTSNTTVLAVSQSGETADTLAAIRDLKQRSCNILAIVNVLDSSIAREAQSVMYTLAGPEIGVASTKAFVTQVISLYLLAIALGRKRNCLSEASAQALLHALKQFPMHIEQILKTEQHIIHMAQKIVHAKSALFLGRGYGYPVAMEGALKLKEVSYIHAEGYAAGELKHGPIALVEAGLPIIVVAPDGPLLEKVISNLQEVRAREGHVIVVATQENQHIATLAQDVLWIPKVHPMLAPLAASIPLQLLAYHVADLRGTDVDQPRNLAKSVTVE